ncbi:MAG: cob(I)yrinic acid a,c-diamide adenosyltransferase [Syntrophales bacterium]|nr:cob(I)yrinic acid a,c-diamide adenosyltransferase [Syntrophales bacterium]MDD5643324.1 cob(I)yrinic acid a,c-diamide adenosyltransferase [Syntrophales bacterium]
MANPAKKNSSSAKIRSFMTREHLTKGLIQVYTGDGKGKTTCALGLALRAVGQGLQVYMIQFLKGRETGEAKAAARLAPEMTLRYLGRPGLVNLRAPAPEDLARVKEAWDLARQVISAGAHDLVILDEINLALTHGLIPLEEVLKVLQGRPPGVEVVLTGRQAPPELVALADLVTEMRSVKHYYQAGVKSRRGIEW